jgi:two-component system sensor histidine kinase/response regulator
MSREDERGSQSKDGRDKTPSVLIVDHDPLMVALLTGVLKSRNYSVIKSYSGAEALRILKNQSVDLIICDVVMPSMTGYEFMQRVKNETKASEVPFVFMTSNDTFAALPPIHEVKESEPVVPKSAEPHELLSLVRRKLGDFAAAEALTKRDFDAYRRRVVHTLSHEFRTPLTAINIGMELLMEHRGNLDSDKAGSILEAVRRGGLRLEKLVKDFLTLQQIEAGIATEAFVSSSAEMAASTLLEHFIVAKAAAYEKEGIQFTVSDSSKGARIKVVEAQILDCIDRLVSNAEKFSPAHRTIEIELWTSEAEVGFSIKDRGCGIDREKLADACDIFGQINREQNEQQGGGLGLPIVSSYVTSHKGRLEFSQRQGGGTKVMLVLPKVTSKENTNPSSTLEH